jgi:hypothetical protein
MNWNLEGLRVEATYLEHFPIVGKVTLSRVAYGGRVMHHVTLDQPITVYGAIRGDVVIDHAQVERVFETETA